MGLKFAKNDNVGRRGRSTLHTHECHKVKVNRVTDVRSLQGRDRCQDMAECRIWQSISVKFVRFGKMLGGAELKRHS